MMITRRETTAYKQRFAHLSSEALIAASSFCFSSSDLPTSHSGVGRSGENMIATPTIQKTGKSKQKSNPYPAINVTQQTYRSRRQTNSERALSARHPHWDMDQQLRVSQSLPCMSRVEVYAVEELSLCVVCLRKTL